MYCQVSIIKHFLRFIPSFWKKNFFLRFLVSEECGWLRPAADFGTNKMKLNGQLEELVQRTERTEAEVELLLAELGTLLLLLLGLISNYFKWTVSQDIFALVDVT